MIRSEIESRDSARATKAKPNTKMTTPHKRSVLVAAANTEDRLQYSSRLAAEGYDVANVSDARTCLDAVRETLL